MFLVFFFLIIGLVAYFGYVYNDFMSLQNKIGEEWQSMCTSLKDRFKILEELMDANKDLSFDYQSVKDLMEKLQTVTSKEEFVPLYQSFENKLNEFLKLIDNEKNITTLTNLSNTNSKIEYMKNFYNDNVGSYNKKIQMFPTNLVAKFMKYNPDVIIP